MKILLFGRNGQVGWELARLLGPLGDLVAHDLGSLDLTDAQATRAIIRDVAPKIIVNAAAYTAVDRAESEVDKATAINAEAPRVISEEANRLECLVVHYSTDYVFDGSKVGAYEESDTTDPLNAYGRTKLAGERAIIASGCAHLIFRTSWIYGARGQNFLLAMLRLGRERAELAVVDDQVGAPTWSGWIAAVTVQALAQLTERGALQRDRAQLFSGLYHLSAGGQTSWCGFARSIFQSVGISCRVNAITTADYPTAARRPLNSLLDNEKLFERLGLRLPEWREGLRLAIEDLRAGGKLD